MRYWPEQEEKCIVRTISRGEDAEGDEIFVDAVISFIPAGYEAGYPPSLYEPGEPSRWTEANWYKAYLDKHDVKDGQAPLTEAEIASLKAWFETREGQDEALKTANEGVY